MKVLYCQYNRSRKSPYQTETSIFQKNGKRYCSKRALTHEAKDFVRSMQKNLSLLEDSLVDSNITHCKIVKGDDDKIVFEYVEGASIEKLMFAALREKNSKVLSDLIDEYHSILSKSFLTVDEMTLPPFYDKKLPNSKPNISFSGVSNIDLTPANILKSESGEYRIIDYEWVYHCSLPINFVFYRGIHYFFVKYENFLHKSIPAAEVFWKKYGISTEIKDAYESMEKAFLDSILKKNILTHQAQHSYMESVRLKDEMIARQEGDIVRQESDINRQINTIGKQEADIIRQTDTIKKQEADIIRQTDTIKKQEADIIRQTDTIKKQEADIIRQTDTIKKQEADIIRQTDTIKKQEADIIRQTDTIKKQEADIIRQTDTIKRQEENITRQEADIIRQTDTIKKQEADIIRQVETIKKQEADINRQVETIKSQEKTITRQEADITRQVDMIKILELDLSNAQKELDRVMNTLSMKLTKPLRSKQAKVLLGFLNGKSNNSDSDLKKES